MTIFFVLFLRRGEYRNYKIQRRYKTSARGQYSKKPLLFEYFLFFTSRLKWRAKSWCHLVLTNFGFLFGNNLTFFISYVSFRFKMDSTSVPSVSFAWILVVFLIGLSYPPKFSIASLNFSIRICVSLVLYFCAHSPWGKYRLDLLHP
jgi:hypothetical protein